MNDYRKGDVFYISNSKFYATDPDNPDGRPGVIVSSDEQNENSDVVEVVYLTSQPKHDMPTHVEILCKVPSTALCETIYTVKKDRLSTFIRNCTKDEIQALDKGLMNSLGIYLRETNVRPVTDTFIELKTERDLFANLYTGLVEKLLARC